jgi:hypothetical protein
MLAALSVVGAFLGSARAKVFFNSLPLQVYWFVLAAVFAMGLAAFPMLRRKPSLLLIHVGCMLVLGGGMCGSQTGHRLAARLLGINKIPEGYLVVYEGDTENHVVAEDLQTVLGELPFSIKLKDFRIEYYTADAEQVGNVYVETQDGQHVRLEAEPGQTHSLGEDKGAIRVVHVFRNFKIRIEDGERIVTDDEGAAENPAVEVEIERPDANTVTRYVFERFPGFGFGEDGVQLRYISQEQPPVRDYISDVVVVRENEEVAGKLIEVNHPLHYGGYHFYQHSYDAEAGRYTVLSVTSDSGLWAVFGGYLMLTVGVLWRFWLRHVLERSRRRLVT